LPQNDVSNALAASKASAPRVPSRWFVEPAWLPPIAARNGAIFVQIDLQIPSKQVPGTKTMADKECPLSSFAFQTPVGHRLHWQLELSPIAALCQ
jgi:hypothetical protein